MSACPVTLPGRALAPGSAGGATLVLARPLSFWGGVDPTTGRILRAADPQGGVSVAGRILVMPSGRGSSSSSSVLAEAIRLGTAPAAIVLKDQDLILALGSLVASELYGRRCPVVTMDGAGYRAAAAASRLVVEAPGLQRPATVTIVG